MHWNKAGKRRGAAIMLAASRFVGHYDIAAVHAFASAIAAYAADDIDAGRGWLREWAYNAGMASWRRRHWNNIYVDPWAGRVSFRDSACGVGPYEFTGEEKVVIHNDGGVHRVELFFKE